MSVTNLLEQNVRWGVIDFYLPCGAHYRFGQSGPKVNWVINNQQSLQRIQRDWEFELGETYMTGGWDVVDCELRDLLSVLRVNFKSAASHRGIQLLLRAGQQWNKVARAYRNVARHYDLDEEFFRLFLDEDMHYSCAYFAQENYSLEQAQQAKCELIAKKLLLQPGQTVLDIGCGWGSLAMYLAEHHNVNVVGITLSRKQLEVARRRARERGLADKVRFELQDYREHRANSNDGQYDRISSVGMFEHVGLPFYHRYFKTVKELLKPDGVALVHTIGRNSPPGSTNPWIRKYIFPGGYIPALSEMSQGIEGAGLINNDMEILRLHYAKTLHEWANRFHQHRDHIAASMGEQFCRMWEFYLSICEVVFHYDDLVVFQAQLSKRHGVVPITRDYLLTTADSRTPRGSGD